MLSEIYRRTSVRWPAPAGRGQARGRRGADQPPSLPLGQPNKSAAQSDTLAAGIGRAFQPFTNLDHMQA